MGGWSGLLRRSSFGLACGSQFAHHVDETRNHVGEELGCQVSMAMRKSPPNSSPDSWSYVGWPKQESVDVLAMR